MRLLPPYDMAMNAKSLMALEIRDSTRAHSSLLQPDVNFHEYINWVLLIKSLDYYGLPWTSLVDGKNKLHGEPIDYALFLNCNSIPRLTV